VEDFPVRIVMLDTLVQGAPHGELSEGRLEWLDRTLAAQPDRPTLIGMHHPPFICGIRHMDNINLRDADRFAAVVAKHPQLRRIICGHHHRSITTMVGQAIASISPSTAHQVELDLAADAPSAFMLEPPGFQLHHWSPAHGFVTHTALVERYPGPFPFVPED
jgi:Icc protein